MLNILEPHTLKAFLSGWSKTVHRIIERNFIKNPHNYKPDNRKTFSITANSVQLYLDFSFQISSPSAADKEAKTIIHIRHVAPPKSDDLYAIIFRYRFRKKKTKYSRRVSGVPCPPLLPPAQVIAVII